MRFDKAFRSFWLALMFLALALPIGLYLEGAEKTVFSLAIQIAAIALFAFSLPSSIFLAPVFAGFWKVLELDTSTMEGAYLYLGTLSIAGLMQWFWLMPRYLGEAGELRMPTIFQE